MENDAAGDAYYANLECFYAWPRALTRKNNGKVGKPFVFPDSYFAFLAVVRARTGTGFRGLQDFSGRLVDAVRERMPTNGTKAGVGPSLRAPHFTQIRRRLAEVRPDRGVMTRIRSTDPLYICLDVRGTIAASPVEWRRVVLARRVSRGWIRIPGPGAAGGLGGEAPRPASGQEFGDLPDVTDFGSPVRR